MFTTTRKSKLISVACLLTAVLGGSVSSVAFAKTHTGGGFPQSRTATGNTVFIFNPNIHRWALYDSNGDLIRTGRASGGRGYCADVHRRCKTPVGTFHVYDKQGPGFKSSKFPAPYGGAPMPYAMFFYKGFAVHGSYEVPNYNASHGCIRVIPADARWLNHGPMNYGATVIVYPY
jgi:lipoprotein-anchoring transpeptidase ErfK/SrfK